MYGHLGNSSELNNVTIDRVETVKYLGVYIDSGLKWAAHNDHLTFTISRNIGIISRVKYFLNKQSLLLLYNTLVLPYINYRCFIWGFTYQNYMSKIELLQKRVVRIIDNQHRLAHSNPIFKLFNIIKVRDVPKLQLISIMHRKMIGSLPKELDDMFLLTNNSSITRSRPHFKEAFSRKHYRTRVASWMGSRFWNNTISPNFSNIDVSSMSKENIKMHVKRKLLSTNE